MSVLRNKVLRAIEELAIEGRPAKLTAIRRRIREQDPEALDNSIGVAIHELKESNVIERVGFAQYTPTGQVTKDLFEEPQS